MKKLFLFIALFAVVTGAFSQGPPVKATTNIVANKTNETLFNTEGDYFNIVGQYYAYSPAQSTPHSATTALTTLFTGTIATQVGFLTRFNKSISFTTDGPCFLAIDLQRVGGIFNDYERISVPLTYTFGASGGTFTLPYDVTFDENGLIKWTFTSNSTSNPNIHVNGTGVMIPAGQNAASKLAFMQISDSQTYAALGNIGGGSVGNPGSTMHGRRIVDSLRTLGSDIRLINKGVSGITTALYIPRLTSGEFDDMIRETNLFEVHLGANDASLGSAASQNYNANMQTIIDYILKVKDRQFATLGISYQPTIIVTSEPGTSQSPRQTNAPSYRAVEAALPGLAKYSTRHIIYVDFSSVAPDPTTNTDPLFTESGTGAGQGLGYQVHLNGGTGEALVANLMMTAIRSSTWYTNQK